jgi:hypothetical protein
LAYDHQDQRRQQSDALHQRRCLANAVNEDLLLSCSAAATRASLDTLKKYESLLRKLLEENGDPIASIA